MKKFLRALTLLMAMLALGMQSGALAMPEEDDIPLLDGGKLMRVLLGEAGMEFAFIPPSNSVYDLCLFPVDGEINARAELWLGDELLAEGEDSMLPLSSRLISGERYTIRLFGSGSVRVEMARHALSRCVAMPMQLEAGGDEYTKAIARSGDVHWYGVNAGTDTSVVMAAVPEEDGPALAARLFDEGGNLLAEATRTQNGAFILDFEALAEKQYYIRINAADGGTGSYSLGIEPDYGRPAPDAIYFEQPDFVIMGRNTARLRVKMYPSEASDILLWESSDASVAQVSQTGRITGRREGTAMITAYAPGGVYARCRVEVRYVGVESIDLISESISMNVGDDTSLECIVLPENASDGRIEFEVSPEGIVKIEGPGILKAVGEGTAIITARTADGGFEDYARVTVGPAVKRYRALLVGEQNYAATVAASRPGSANSITGIRSMLESMSYEGVKFHVSTRLDASRDGVIAAIRDSFSAATAQDISLFYITCHGYYRDGMTYLQMSDGSVLTAAELEAELRRIPGEIVLMVDCCGSGGILGRGSSTRDILNGIISVFSGNGVSAGFSASKYRVLASAALEQDSYRISLNTEAVESDMATVFARSLCEAAGWSISAGKRSAMRADVNFDGDVDFNELFNYVRRRVMWYLDQAGGRSGAFVQTVQAWPEGDTSPIFKRN